MTPLTSSVSRDGCTRAIIRIFNDSFDFSLKISTPPSQHILDAIASLVNGDKYTMFSIDKRASISIDGEGRVVFRVLTWGFECISVLQHSECVDAFRMIYEWVSVDF